MSELSNNVVKDLLSEVQLLKPTIVTCLKKGMKWSDIILYLRHRIFASEDYCFSKPIWTSPEGFLLYNRRDIIAYRELILFDEYKTSIWRKDFETVKMPVVLDVGANVGFFSSLCCRLNPTVRLKCFEMVSKSKAIIESRLSKCGAKDFEIITGVVGTQDGGTITIHYDMPYSMGNTVNQTTGRFHETVPRISLNCWWSRQAVINNEPVKPFLVKIDVEGAERETVSGGMNCIAAADYVLIELHSPDDRILIEKLTKSHELIFDSEKPGFMWICVFRKRNH